MFSLFKKFNLMIMGAVLLSIIAIPHQKALATWDNVDGMSMFSPDCTGLCDPFTDPDYDTKKGYGSRILHGNCDDSALPSRDNELNEDGTPKLPWQKSCKGQGITLETFKLTVRHDPLPTDDVARAAIFPLLAVVDKTSFINTFELSVGEIEYSTWLTFFTAFLAGDKVCVFAWIIKPDTIYPVAVVGSKIVEENKREGGGGSWGSDFNNIVTPNTDGLTNGLVPSAPWHCLPAPEPLPVDQELTWGNLISPVCTNYDASSSNFRYPPSFESPEGKNRSFTGVVMECVEDTMTNIFTETDVNGDTFFSIMRDNLRGLIKGLMVLYVIFFGYPYLYGKKGIKSQEWHWFVLKIALVAYFAIGSGMSDLLPSLQTTMRGLSLMVMEAGSGDIIGAQQAQMDLSVASGNLAQKNSELVLTRQKMATNPGNQTYIDDVNQALIERDAALNQYYNIKSKADSFGYRYCDFRDLGPSAYAPGKEFMRLWDMMDCKISKFLGVGDNAKAPEMPQILVIGMASVFSNFLGQFVLPLILIFLAYILLIVVRVCHIYLMSSIGLILLVYMSPLIIPAVLFNYTKYIFEGWFKQVIAYIIQPIILFAFLVFLFSAYDMAIYGGNHHFVPMQLPHTADENHICMTYVNSKLPSKDSICEPGEFENVFMPWLRCDDPDAIGCVFQKMDIRSTPIIFGLTIYQTDMDFDMAVSIIINMLILLLISVLSHAVLKLVEEMSVSLTNAAGGGAKGLSGAPTASPQQLMSVAGKMGSFAMKSAQRGGDAMKKQGAVKRDGGAKDTKVKDPKSKGDSKGKDSKASEVGKAPSGGGGLQGGLQKIAQGIKNKISK